MYIIYIFILLQSTQCTHTFALVYLIQTKGYTYMYIAQMEGPRIIPHEIMYVSGVQCYNSENKKTTTWEGEYIYLIPLGNRGNIHVTFMIRCPKLFHGVGHQYEAVYEAHSKGQRQQHLQHLEQSTCEKIPIRQIHL